ncbi:MAG: sulfatase-like hydrolase/transferase [Hyphomicrobiales bacterium]
MKQPNIIYILTDQHNPFITGCYGDDIVRTPNLDRLASQGVVFDNAYTPSPICVPARMSLLTGCYPHKQDCWTNSDILPSGRPTFAHALGGAGYATRLVGRMHSIGPDQLRGFSERFVGDHSTNWVGGTPHSLGILTGTSGPARVSIDKSGAGQSSYEVHDRDVVKSCQDLSTIIAAEQAAPDAAPFFLHVGLMLPHQPYVSNAELFDYYHDRIPDPDTNAPDAEDEHPYLRDWKELTDTTDISPDDMRRARAAYYGLVETTDRMIGEILESYREKGLLENTLVIYVSDHGDQIGERGLWWKQTFYEQSVRVPMIMSWPGRIPAGERRSQIVNLVDIAPTLVDAAQGDQVSQDDEKPEIDGTSLLQLATDGTAPWDNETYSEYCTDGMNKRMPQKVQQRMIRSGPWKLVYYHGYPSQLFNLEDDPLEMQDLVAVPQHADLVQSLQAKVLQGWDPDLISQKMEQNRRQKTILSEWSQQTKPIDTYRWMIETNDNWLDS